MEIAIYDVIDEFSNEINKINCTIDDLTQAEIEEACERLHEKLEYLETLLELHFCNMCPASDLNIYKYCGVLYSIGLATEQSYYCKFHASLKQQIDAMKLNLF